MAVRSTSTAGVAASRVRMPLVAAGAVSFIGAVLVDAPSWLTIAALVLFAIALGLYFRVGTPRTQPVDLASPVRGRWVALNSPSTRVPSHRLHAWAQTYAIDLVAEPGDGSRPEAAWWPLARRPAEFPAFGQAILAPVGGRVIRRFDAARDHWSRTSPPAMVYLVAEGLRELLGPWRILGNHVVIEAGDDTYVLLAHLRRRSIRVSKGDRVSVGDVIAECGNSGNSSEPHLHIQAMDRASTWTAAGRPIRFGGNEPPEDHQPLLLADHALEARSTNVG